MKRCEKQTNHTNGEVIWVTGASSGIGRDLCLLLAHQGHMVIASARNREALDWMAIESEHTSGIIVALPFDIKQDEELADVREKLELITGHLDRVILNAGRCEYLQFPEPDWNMMRRVMDVNFHGTVNCLQLALPMLRRSSGRGHIIGIVSQVVGAPFAKAEAYGASKAALHYLLDSLRIDLARENMDVTVVNPGFVETPMTAQNDFDMPFLMDSYSAARRILKHALNRPYRYTFPKRLSWLLKMSRVCPGLWRRMVMPACEADKVNHKRKDARI